MSVGFAVTGSAYCRGSCGGVPGARSPRCPTFTSDWPIYQLKPAAQPSSIEATRSGSSSSGPAPRPSDAAGSHTSSSTSSAAPRRGVDGRRGPGTCLSSVRNSSSIGKSLVASCRSTSSPVSSLGSRTWVSRCMRWRRWRSSTCRSTSPSARCGSSLNGEADETCCRRCGIGAGGSVFELVTSRSYDHLVAVDDLDATIGAGADRHDQDNGGGRSPRHRDDRCCLERQAQGG